MDTCLIFATAFGILAAAFVVNIPLGYLCARQRRFSLKWFLLIHLSVPLLHVMRTQAGFGHWMIPLLVIAVIAGQILGGGARGRGTVGKTGEAGDK